MRCGFCSTQLDPYEVEKEKDAVESTWYDTTVFTCPQCGGELSSMDNEATSFCSFCGASTILDSRISREKRPDYILPFQKTKEDCKKQYSSAMKRALFAPKQLKDQAYIDSFRGIYMPYWIYDYSQKGPIRIKGKRSHRSGDYIITDHYDLTGNLDGEYNGLYHDASSSFADNLSEAIAPFQEASLKRFTPSFLSGFYADTADVEKSVYEDDMLAITTQATVKTIKNTKPFKKYTLEIPSGSNERAVVFHSQLTATASGMFPVWFLSYQKNGRVAYAAVNGQTGKLAADIPVEPKKYLLGSVLLAIPLFFLLNLFFVPQPTILLGIAMFFACFTLLLYFIEISQIARRDLGEDDKGLMGARAAAGNASSNQSTTSGSSKGIWEKLKKHSGLMIVLFVVVGMHFISTFLAVIIGLAGSILGKGASGTILSLILLIAGVILCIMTRKKITRLTIPKKRYLYRSGLAALIIGTLVFLVHPASDIYYYAGGMVAIIAILLAVSDLIYYYNILATRRLPQFDHKGGDDNA